MFISSLFQGVLLIGGKYYKADIYKMAQLEGRILKVYKATCYERKIVCCIKLIFFIFSIE